MISVKPPSFKIKDDGYLLERDDGEFIFYNKYSYIPLSSPRAIRLIRLSPRTPGLSLTKGTVLNQFTIEEHSIDEPGLRYAAVSYTWGNTIREVPIILGSGIRDSVYLTTPNAWEAVNRLGLISLLWIDQICIDQDNFIEKDLQIGLMNEIYSRCWVCNIWLGSEDEHTKAAFGLLQKLNTLIPTSEALPFNWGTLLNLSHDKIREMHRAYYGYDRLPPPEDPGWVSFASCLCRPWFHRLWTFQEAILPHMGSITIQCGLFNSTLTNLVRAAIFLGNWYVPGVNHTPGRNIIYHIASMQYRVRHNLPRSLLALLNTTAGQDCGDPRDKIYALLGLRFEELLMDPIIIDTKKAVRELYIDATKSIISSEVSLLVCCSASGRRGGKVQDLPSWVPDWTGRIGAAPFESVARPYNFSADNGRELLKPSKEFSKQLIAKGNEVDKIFCIIPYELPENSTVGELSTYLYSLLPLTLTMLNARSNEDEVAQMVRIAKTVTVDGQLQTHDFPKLEWTTEVVTEKLRHVFDKSHPTIGEDFDKWLHDFSMQAAICKFRRFAILEKHHLGLVPGQTRDGDVVAILHGSSIPVVLRSVEDDQFQLIGPCFVDGLMYGEKITWPEEEAYLFRII